MPQQLAPLARLYVFGVGVAGLITLVARLALFPLHFGIGEIVLLALALALGRHTVKIGKNLEMSGVLPLIFLALVTRGVPAALDVALVSMMSLCLLSRPVFALHRTAFNVASLLCTTLVSGVLYEAWGPDLLHPMALTSLLAVLVALMVFYFMNTLLVAIVLALSTRSAIMPLWWSAFAGAGLSYLAGASLAVAGAAMIRTMGIGASALMLAPVLLILQSYQLGADLREERRKGAETLDRLDQESCRRQEAEKRLGHLTTAIQKATRHALPAR